MKKINVGKTVDFTVRMSFSHSENQTIQTYSFITSNKKNLNYVSDSRYLLKKKLEKIFSENLLDGYVARKEEQDCIKFIYNSIFEVESKVFNVSFFLPPYSGCLFCCKAEQEGDFIYCPEKKKHYDSMGIKRCPIFSSKEDN